MSPDSQPVDDAELTNRAVSGEPLAMEKLLMLHHRNLMAVIQSKIPETLQSTVSPEDILQETFAEAYRGIGSFRPDGANAFYRWLCTIADHRVLDVVRAHKAAKRGGGKAPISAAPGSDDSGMLALLDLVAVHSRTPSRSAAGHEAVAAVQRAISGLKPEYEEAIRLRYIEGRSVADAATRMGKTERAVHKLCSRAMQKLRESLGDDASFLSKN